MKNAGCGQLFKILVRKTKMGASETFSKIGCTSTVAHIQMFAAPLRIMQDGEQLDNLLVSSIDITKTKPDIFDAHPMRHAMHSVPVELKLLANRLHK